MILEFVRLGLHNSVPKIRYLLDIGHTYEIADSISNNSWDVGYFGKGGNPGYVAGR